MAVYGAAWFGLWFYGADEKLLFPDRHLPLPRRWSPSSIALHGLRSIIRDTPQSCGPPFGGEVAQRLCRRPTMRQVRRRCSRPVEIFSKHGADQQVACGTSPSPTPSSTWCATDASTGRRPILTRRAGLSTSSRPAGPTSPTRCAAIPGTLICGWLSDKVFHGRRALPTILFMAIVAAVSIVLYWQNSRRTTSIVAIGRLIAIGFFIYGPVMLIGVQALDLAPKNAAGTAAGLTGFMGYVLGTAHAGQCRYRLRSLSLLAGTGPSSSSSAPACSPFVFMALTYKKGTVSCEEQVKTGDRYHLV